MAYDIDTYSVELRRYADKYSRTTSGKYLEIPLPDEIEKLAENPIESYFSDGEEQVYVSLKPKEEPPSLRIDFEEASTRHDLDLKYHEDRHPKYAVSIPAEYIEYRGESPFKGAEPGLEINLELNYKNKSIRAYQLDDYQFRLEDLVEQGNVPQIKSPAALPLAAASNNRSIGVNQDIKIYDRFRLKPFFGLTEEIVSYLNRKRELEVEDETVRLPYTEIESVVDECTIRSEDTKIEISSENEREGDDVFGKTVLEKEVAASRISSEGFELDIPRTGSYTIRFTMSGIGISTFRLQYYDDEWTLSTGEGFDRATKEPSQTPIDLYIPVPDHYDPDLDRNQDKIDTRFRKGDQEYEWHGGLQIKT